MARAPSIFRQSDVTRAIRAARAAGVENVRVDITKDGKISIIVGAAAKQAAQVTPEEIIDKL
jgi:hypothetical protein